MALTMLVIIGAFLIIVFSQYNGIVRSKKKVEQELSSIDVYLTQRFDLIPNLVECVKAYTQYESEIFEKIAQMRSEYMNTKDLEEGKKLYAECDKLIAVGENYPELKSSEQFLSLQQKLTKIESQLQAARRLYNGAVTTYNTKISVIPTNIIANMFGFEEAKLFELETEKARENIKIEL